jgi:hypothetical protein
LEKAFERFSLYPLYKGVPKRECLGTFFIFTEEPVQQQAPSGIKESR